MKRNGTKFAIRGLIAIATIWTAVSEPVAGQTPKLVPEPAPGYISLAARRVDASLHAVAFHDTKNGVAAGDHGTMLRTDNAGLTWQQQSTPVDCRLEDVIWLDDRHVVAVGGAYDRITRISRGVVIASHDGGVRWQRTLDDELPRLRSLVRASNGALIASGDWSESSKSRHFESRDGGKTWNAADPSQENLAQPADLSPESQLAWSRAGNNHAPIRDVWRVDEANIWSVGDHGLILHSKDAGETWHESRGGGRQCSILVIANSPSTVPWSIVGKETLEMKHRVSMLLLDSASMSDPTHAANQLTLTRQAASGLGVAGVDALRIARGGLADAENDRLQRHLLQWLAVHRPAVVLIDDSITNTMRKQIESAALAVDVKRIASYSQAKADHARQSAVLHAAAMLPKSGVLAGDLTEDALHLVAPETLPPIVTAVRRRYDVAGASRTGESVVSGIVTNPHQRLSSREENASRRQLQIIQARMSETRRIDDLIGRSGAVDQYTATLKLLLDQTADADRFRLAWNVLRRIKTANSVASPAKHHAFYQATLREVAARFERHSVGKWAQIRSEAITHSSEWNHLRDSLRNGIDTSSPIKTVAAEVVPVSPFQNMSGDRSTSSSQITTASWETGIEAFGGVRQASATVPVLVPDRTPMPIETPASPSASVDLTWEFYPAVVVARDAARQRGDSDTLQEAGRSANLDRIVASPSDHRWSRLIDAQSHDRVLARRAADPPRLDGMIDDSIWNALQPAGGDRPVFQVAYDDQYVYVAIRCKASDLRPDSNSATTRESSTRDQDLTTSDRIQLRLDTDKDLLTSMQLETTDSGRTHDSVDGQRQWQPTWYVATNRTAQHVDAEIAILRQDIVDLPIHAGESWFVSARTIGSMNQSSEPPMPDPDHWRQVIFR